MSLRLAVVVSHPIQHFVPFYRALAAEGQISLVVIYAARIGCTPYFDRAMNTTIRWKMDALGGYDHVFLPEADGIAETGPLALDNPSVGAELSRQAPDAVLIHGYNMRTSLRALRWCRRNGVPALMIADSELRTERSAIRRLLKRLVLPRLFRRVAGFLTVGDCNEAYYLGYGVDRGKLHRAPFTIDEATYLAARANRTDLRRAVRARLGIGADEVVALTVGKLSPRKRPGDVVEAATRLAGRVPGLSFLLAGDGTERARLARVAAERDLPILMPGFVNLDDLPGVYAAADLILHPSARDPHPLVMSEAACIGLPLVVSDRVGAVGPTDVARAGENALVFPCGDVSAMAEAVAGLATNPARRAAMGRRSVEIFGEVDMAHSVAGTHAALRAVTA